MCGLAGFATLDGHSKGDAQRTLKVMDKLLAHRGPDGNDTWISPDAESGFMHRRLAIIDLSEGGHQPKMGPDGKVLVFNGEIYNHQELRRELGDRWSFETNSDSETLLAAYTIWGEQSLDKLRGMFAFAIWDPKTKELFCARDKFGIKPFYYAVVKGVLYFASEAKALLPFLTDVTTDPLAMSEYLTFQYAVSDRTLFAGISQLLPAHFLVLKNGRITKRKYWDVNYHHDNSKPDKWWQERLRELLDASVGLHLRSDVPVGSYLSGGVDSGLITLLASEQDSGARRCFHGKFTQFPGYDESGYAVTVAEQAKCDLYQIDIGPHHFSDNIEKVMYHLDYPVAGPGSFPQYMVSGLASQHVKVVVGGQGGDEIFGGYARYFAGYLEALLKSGIDGQPAMTPGLAEIGSSLSVLKQYKPMMRQFWSSGLFDDFPSRYLRLIDRSADMDGEVDWTQLDRGHAHTVFHAAFTDGGTMPQGQPFDQMTRFDFKYLLPALLQVEDRMSMAHGIESRVPFLDSDLVEFVASAPTSIKLKAGRMKQMLRESFSDVLPVQIFDRPDKMGFPVPLKEWWAGDLKDFVHDLFGAQVAKERPFLVADKALDSFNSKGQFSRTTWALLSLEIWQRQFHDQAPHFRSMVEKVDGDG